MGLRRPIGALAFYKRCLLLAPFGILVLVVLFSVALPEKSTVRPQLPSLREHWSLQSASSGGGAEAIEQPFGSRARLPEPRSTRDWSAAPPLSGGGDR